jgi:hypothetical protein
MAVGSELQLDNFEDTLLGHEMVAWMVAEMDEKMVAEMAFEMAGRLAELKVDEKAVL